MFSVLFCKESAIKFFNSLIFVLTLFLLPQLLLAGPKEISISDAVISEGNSSTQSLIFTLTTTDNASGDSIDYATGDLTATSSDSDYTAVSGTFTFPDNNHVQTISVTINGDVKVESDETFQVTLSNPSGGGIQNIDDGVGIGTIVNDDFPVDLSVAKTSSSAVVNQLENMSYSISAENLDTTNSAAHITVTDTLPTGMTYVSSSGSGWSCTSSGSPVSLTCSLDTLAPQTSSILTLNVTAPDSNLSGTVTFNNTATVVHPSDPDLSNNSSVASVTLNRLPTPANDTASTTSHTVVTGNVLTNDTDLDGDTLSVVNTGSHTINYGAINIAADGSWTYTPGYFSGVTDSFTYTVSDGNGGTSTATLQISIGSACSTTGVNESSREFCLRKQTVLFGDMVTVGNSVIVPPNPQEGSTTCDSYTTGSYYANSPNSESNADLYLCNYKPDTLTNASSAEVVIPAGSSVKWAGLYVQSIIAHGDTTPINNMDIKIKNGSDSYVSVGNPVVVNHLEIASRDYDGYSAYLDVTNVLISNNWVDGVYTVGDIPITDDNGLNGIGKYGAWSLVIIYENSGEALKSVSVYDGWEHVYDGSGDVDITVDNFYTPTNGDISSTVSVFTAEGDRYITGDTISSSTTQIDIFSSEIEATGTRTPLLTNNQGIDIHTYDIGSSGLNLLANAQSSIDFTFNSTQDYYMPSMLAFSTEVYHPRMCYYEEVYSSDGQLSAGDLIDKGSDIRARVLVKNDQNEPAENVLLYRSFNDELPYVHNSTYVNNTLTPDLNSTTSSVTDALDGDIFDYSSDTNLFSLHLGNGATSISGGDFENNQTALFDFNATANFDGNTSITYQVAYTMPTIGFRYDGELAKCEDFNNTFGTNPIEAPEPSSADIVNNFVDVPTYNSGTRYITTKVANSSTQITGVYIDKDTSQADIFDTAGSGQLFTIIPYLTDDTCTGEIENIIDPNTNTQLVIDIPAGNSNADGTMLVSATAHKVRRMQMIVIDSSTLSVDAQNCILNSSTTGNFARVSQCANSEGHYTTAFGESAWSRCGESNGEPCISSNHGAANPSSPTYNPLYDNELGCYMCTFNIEPACTTDNFAIRPNVLDISSNHLDMPNLLRAAKDYNVSVNAYNYGTTTNTPNYNVTNAHTIYDINVTKYDRNNEVNNSMAGDPSFNSLGFDMTDGQSTRAGVAGNEVAGISYNDIGKVNIQMKDKTWAAIDNNDNTPQDCSANGTWICGDLNVTFIPDHFDINVTITNNDGNPGNITYIANEVDQMAARLHTGITARAADGNTTLNFAPFPMYENNVTVIPVVVDNAYAYPDSNETNITNLSIGFTSGVKILPWSEDNTSQYLRFNFARDINQTSNPFEVNSTEVTISITSDYVDPYDGDSVTIDNKGISDINGTATMLYGRTHASRQRYEDNNGTANIYYESYCFRTTNGNNACNKNLLPDGVNSNRTDDIRWYLNTDHDKTRDGNISSLRVAEKGANNAVQEALANRDETVSHISQIELNYDETFGYPYKTTMESNASKWLIYNRDDPTAIRNHFSVEFEIVEDDWGGEHNTSSTTRSTGPARSNRRSTW